MPDSDSIYHCLFSHPRMVEELVREFVPEALAAGLDFSGLQRVNAKFYTRGRFVRRRESDVIWRLPSHEGADSELYLMIEFQSKSEWWMALRTQVYEGLLWQQVIDEKKLEADVRLPPLLLVALYNGAGRWDAPTETRELIEVSRNSALWPWQPQVPYYLLNIGAFPKARLAGRANLAALLFRLEQGPSLEEFNETLDELTGWFREHKGYERLQELFAELVRAALVRRGLNVPMFADLLEMNMFKSRIETHIEKWKQQLLPALEAEAKAKAMAKAMAMAEAMAEDMAEAKARAEEARGRAEGEAKGRADSLLRLLVARFGALAPSWRKRIGSAELAMLERWFDRAIVAPDLSSVFADP